jgi:uncharacterized protein
MKTTDLDRLAARARPEGSPVMHQTWENLLFLHWSMDPRVMRPHIPDALELDLFEDRAWVGVTPFAVTGLHLPSLPAIPGFDSFLELNVRTYVHYRGMPGVWFFSLDASKTIPAMAARFLYGLPYFKAEMEFLANGAAFSFSSRRLDRSGARFEARWRMGELLRDADAESLAFFLVERYCLFTGSTERLSKTRIYHHPWILEEGLLESHHSSMISAAGLPDPVAAPLVHFSRSLNVEVWPPAPA